MTTAGRNRWWLLVAIVLGATWWFTRGLPPWGDEAHFLHTIRIFGQGLSVDLLRTYPEMSGPLPFVLFAWWGHFVGSGTSGLRVLSALIALATLMLYDRALEQHGLNGRLKNLLFLLFAANPYFVGLSVFVFTDMLALFGMAVVMHATSSGRPWRAALGLAVATLARQYLAFLAAALVLAALFGGRHERGRVRLAWSGAAVAGMLPLAALVWLWGGLSPANDLRHLYVADGLRFDPGALSLYLALPGIYLAPLVGAVLATVPIRRPHLLIACAAAGFVLLFPIAPSLPQLREGIHTVGFVHRASVALLPAVEVQWPFAIGAFMGWAAISVAVLNGRHHVGSISIARWLPLAAIVAFLAVMPFSYMPWEKYALPLLMAVIPLLGVASTGMLSRTT